MNYKCDLCGSRTLERIYSPSTSRKNMSVYICNECALVQSLPRGIKTVDYTPRLSSGADFGNLRYHKGMMVPRVVAFILRYVNIKKRKAILDIGSNRGDLIEALHEINPVANFVGVEPDARIIHSYASHKWLRLYVSRFENLKFYREIFDLIVCLHTLEHTDSVYVMAKKIRKVMLTGGYLFLEVPNIAQINKRDIVEEFFVDKHLYHFSPFSLRQLLHKCGLKIIGLDTRNKVNISVIAIKPFKAKGQFAEGPGVRNEIALIKKLIRNYELNLKRNLCKINKIAEFIKKNCDKRILLWGAGRIFNAFVTNSDISNKDVVGVIDEFIRFKRISGFKIYRSNALPVLAPDIIIIFSREFFQEIRTQIKGILGARPKVMWYGSLIK